MVQDSLLVQVVQQFLGGLRIAELVPVRKGQLKGRAFEMAQQDIQVVRIQQGVLRALGQQIIRMVHDILVNRRGRGDEEHNAGPFPSSGTARLLPGAGNGSRIPAHHAGVQRTDVNAQLQRVGGYHSVHLSVPQALFNLPAFPGQIAAPVAPDFAGIAQRIPDHVLQVAGQHFHRQPGPGKGNGLDAVLEQHPADGPGNRDRALADPQLPVHHRRVVEHKMALAHGGTVFIDQGHRTADQRLRQFLRIGDGGTAENELRMTAVELAQAHQPAEHIGQVAAEDAAVGVDFVNHDIPQVLKQLDPLGVMGQDAGMQHIRVGHHDVACLPHGAAGCGGRIPVVCIGFDINTHALDHVIQLADLVGGQGLCRKQIECPGVLILQDGGKHG